MTIYVDEAIFSWRGKKWCHLFSTDLDELHDFAINKLGLLRGFFQKPPKQSWPHYDITARKRAQAISLGAEPVDRYAVAYLSKVIMTDWVRERNPDAVETMMSIEEKWLHTVIDLRNRSRCIDNLTSFGDPEFLSPWP